MGEYLTVGYKPNFKEVGKTLGSNISKFQEYLKNITEEDSKLLEAGELKLDFDGVTHTIDNTYVLKDIQSKDGYAAVMLNYKKVAINTVLTQDLINEGLAREIVSKIQNLRKTSNFDIADRIEIEYSADKEVKDALKQFKKYVMDEVLATKLTETEVKGEELKINDYTMVVKLKQVK
jgi:isoleucyl-tRNA synthetase